MKETPDLVILYVPCGSEEEAAKMARELLSERLIACGNIYPSRSLYVWESELVDTAEYVLFAKTTGARASEATLRINDLHSYEVPCVLTIMPSAVNNAYYEWVAAQVSGTHEMPVAAKNPEG
jgi:periplasmic divalent cation tolerance protein